ncbi:MAG: hypothetical protein WCF07_04540 [Nitrososphaeraceae archaeon]
MMCLQKTRHDRSSFQSAAISNECLASQDDDNAGNQAGLNQLATFATNCNGDIDMNQGDGAAIASTSRTTSHQAAPQLHMP